MRKLKLGSLFSILLIYLFSVTKTVFAENTDITINDYPYFIEANQNNKSNVILYDGGTNGFGVFFLGDTVSETVTLELPTNGTTETIICNKQIRGYYTNNFLNFKFFPLDSSIQRPTSDYYINYVGGGLYYECSKSGTPFNQNGVYGHIKRIYGNNPDNIHEIRAGVEGDGNDLRRSNNSPLKIISDDDFMALSGYFQDYLAKNAEANPDFTSAIMIHYPDEYFTNTKALSSNRNEIYFNDAGNSGFGLFFLGTGIEGTYYVTDTGGTTLTCQGQINGYYSFSFNDFGMLPLDATTANYKYQNNYNINFETGGWYYNCKNSSNQDYPGVYGYIRLRYNTSNVHELRAGIDSNGHFLNKSPIEVIYSENFRNTNRTLSGTFHNSLSKNSIVLDKFFGDLGITIDGNNIQATGSINDPYYLLPYETYKTAKIYIKSSRQNSSAKVIVTEFDNYGQPVYDYNVTLNNTRTPFGFYGYYDNIDFSNNDSLKSGTISVIITDSANKNRTKTIRFVIDDPQIQIPDITINHAPTCSSGITVTGAATRDPIIKYAITHSNVCDESTTNTRNDYSQGEELIFSNRNQNGQFVCFKATNSAGTRFHNREITGIDTQGPTFTLQDWTGPECTAGKLHIDNVQQVGCLNPHSKPYSWDGISWTTDDYSSEFTSGGIGYKVLTGRARDAEGNSTYHTGKFTWTNTAPELTLPTATKGILTYPTVITGTTLLYEDLIASMGAIDGNCGSSPISKTGTISCSDPASVGEWVNNKGIRVTPPSNNTGQVTCTVRFADDEGSTVSGKVIYSFDTKAPTISIHTQPNPLNICSKTKSISGDINEPGTMRRNSSKYLNNVCDGPWTNYTAGANISFNSENDTGTYVCFKATDSYGNTSYATSTIVDNIDTSYPTFELIGDFNVLECNTGTITITNVQQIGCASGHTAPYSRDQNTWGTTGTFSEYRSGTGSITKTVRVRDSLGNWTGKTQTITRSDSKITGLESIDIGDISEDYSFNPIIKFNISGQGSCETITETLINCTPNVEGELDTTTHTLNISPKANYDEAGSCTLSFTDGDTTIVSTVHFRVKTREYFVVLDKEEETEKGEIRLLDDNKYPEYTEYTEYTANGLDTGLVNVFLIPDINYRSTRTDLKDYSNIGEIKLAESTNGKSWLGSRSWLRSTSLDIDINVDLNAIEEEYNTTNQCLSGIVALEFSNGFIVDPAGNISDKTIINTNNLIVLGNYLIIDSGAATSVTNSTANGGFKVKGYTKNIIQDKTGSIICEATPTCPYFSCNNTGVTSVQKLTPQYEDRITLFGEKRKALFNYGFELQLDPFTNYGNRTVWTGCIIKIKEPEGCDYSTTTINIELVKRPIKAGEYGSENYREGDLGGAIDAGEGDNGFSFFITHPENLSGGGVLGNIRYEIHFTGGNNFSGVADEFYYITGSAVVNGFKEDLTIKRPTFNYDNPRGYLFNFPEYRE